MLILLNHTNSSPKILKYDIDKSRKFQHIFINKFFNILKTSSLIAPKKWKTNSS